MLEQVQGVPRVLIRLAHQVSPHGLVMGGTGPESHSSPEALSGLLVMGGISLAGSRQGWTNTFPQVFGDPECPTPLLERDLSCLRNLASIAVLIEGALKLSLGGKLLLPATK